MNSSDDSFSLASIGMIVIAANNTQIPKTLGLGWLWPKRVFTSRRELIASLRPNHLKHLRADNGDMPESSGRCVEGRPDQSQLDFETAARTLKVLS